MITDETIDLTIIEMARTMKALKALKHERKNPLCYCTNSHCTERWKEWRTTETACPVCDLKMSTSAGGPVAHAAAKRASMDLTRMLANLRAGR